MFRLLSSLLKSGNKRFKRIGNVPGMVAGRLRQPVVLGNAAVNVKRCLALTGG